MSAGGKSGDIMLEANSILMKDLSNLETSTLSASDSGNIKVTTAQNLETENFGRVADRLRSGCGKCGQHRTEQYAGQSASEQSLHNLASHPNC